MFHVINTRTNDKWLSCTSGEPKVYPTVSDAKEAASYLTRVAGKWSYYTNDADSYTDNGPHRHMRHTSIDRKDVWEVRPAEDKEWRKREVARFGDETYHPVPWAKDDVWMGILRDKEEVRDHYLHRSLKEPHLIAYTPSAKHGEADKQVSTSPHKYFEKHKDLFVGVDTKRFLTIWEGQKNADLFNLATTMEEVAMVFDEGPDSCMKGNSTRFFTRTAFKHHPAEAYIGGDLAIAYIRRKGRITARSVVWPEKKVYLRAYGDDAHTLITVLNSSGYKAGGIGGARMAALRIPSLADNAYAMPYIDDASVRVGWDDEEKKTLRLFFGKDIDDGMSAPFETKGYILMKDAFISGLTGKRSYSERFTVHVSETETQTWARCDMSNTNAVSFNGRWYSKKDVPLRYVIYGTSIMQVPAYVKANVCEHTGVEYIDTGKTVIVGLTADHKRVTQRWSAAAAATMAFVDTYDDRIYASWMRSNVWNRMLSITNEHRFSRDADSFRAPVAIDKNNVNLYKRGVTLDSTGNISFVDPKFPTFEVSTEKTVTKEVVEISN